VKLSLAIYAFVKGAHQPLMLALKHLLVVLLFRSHSHSKAEASGPLSLGFGFRRNGELGVFDGVPIRATNCDHSPLAAFLIWLAERLYIKRKQPCRLHVDSTGSKVTRMKIADRI
jgi:hypothetical protein